jgi:hypothetical protein
MSRQTYLLGVGIALVALGLAFTDRALGLRPGVTEANVRRIRAGMTLAEAESVLGPREWDPKAAWGIINAVDPSRKTSFRYPEAFACMWGGADVDVMVFFDSNERVTRVCTQRRHQTPFARLRAWLGW